MKNYLIITTLILSGCARPANYASFGGFEQGTTYSIVAKDAPHGTQKRIDSLFREIDLTFSMFNPASLTSRINRGEEGVATDLFEECFALAREVWAATDGYYDPTVKPLVDAWGFGPGETQAAPRIDSIKEYVGMEKIRIEGGRIIKDDGRVQLDFSSIAKGFTVDLLARLLEAAGSTDYMVEVGGEVRARGLNAAGRPWRIGIDKPTAGMERSLEGVVSFTGPASSIATSGNYRNRFVDENGRVRVHTIDPLTGEMSNGEILSVSIAAEQCAVADAWATGVMATGSVEVARRLLAGAPEGLEHFVIYSAPGGGEERFYSAGFPFENE